MSGFRLVLPDPVSTVKNLPRRPTLFLSASVPYFRPPMQFEPAHRQAVEQINRDFVAGARPERIRAAIIALTRVALGRPGMRLAFGAHPSIGPMVLQVARDMKAPPDSILVFQSDRYRNEFPDSTYDFVDWSCGKLILTEARSEPPSPSPPVPPARPLRRLSPYPNSLAFMRELMVSVPGTCGAVFIGGMNGVVDEADLFSRFQPGVPRFALPSTGSAAERLVGHPAQGFNDTLPHLAAFLTTPSYSVAASMILDELVP